MSGKLHIHPLVRKTTGRSGSLRADSILREWRYTVRIQIKDTGNDHTLGWIGTHVLKACITKKPQNHNKSIANQKSNSSKMISNAISWTHKFEEHMSKRMVCLGFRLQTGIQSGKKLKMDFQNGLNVGKQDLRERKKSFFLNHQK